MHLSLLEESCSISITQNIINYYNIFLTFLDNAPVSKALIAITGAASALNILLPALKISKNIVLFNHFDNSQVWVQLLLYT